MPSTARIWTGLRMGISCKTLDYLFHLSVLFHHVRGQGDCMAYCLARKAISSSLDVWMESIPPNTLDVYNADLPLID